MKIAILTSGILPVPAVQGGAVETLTDFYLAYNDHCHLHDITIYSVWHPDVMQHPALQSATNHYRFIRTDRIIDKLRRNIHRLLHSKEDYYHYTIEDYLTQAIKYLKHEKYDAIILENRPGYAIKLKTITQAPLIYHLHNEKLTATIDKAQTIYDAATTIICVSDYITNCVRTINAKDDKCVTVHNGIDLDAFNKKQVRKPAISFASNDFVLIYSGRMTKEKGIMQLIEAMDMLNNYPNIKLMVIGSTFFANANNDDEFIKELKGKATPLKERIIFTGFIPYHKMPAYLASAHVAIIPSVWDDPFPTTVLEAQAMGLPIIATQRGGIPEEVSKENAVLLTTGKDLSQQLADTILYLYNHPEKCKSMSIASIRNSKQYSYMRYAEDFFNAFTKGIESNNR